MRYKKFEDVVKKDKQYIINIIKSSISIRDCLLKLKGYTSTELYNKFNIFCDEYNVSINHFDNKQKSKQYINDNRKKDVYFFLKENHYISSYKLKKLLFESKIKQNKCENCKLSKWLNKDIPLELHHIDGNKYNNKLENLKILCPNCHYFTDTYKIKNWK